MKPIVNQTEMKIIGIQTRTTNQNGQSFKDMSLLWRRFFSEKVLEKIPAKTTDSIITLYTNYENPDKNNLGEYTAILGAAVENLNYIPDGMVGFTLPAGFFQEHPVHPPRPEEVGPSWQKIWDLPTSICNRNFLGDFEVYEANGNISIFIGVHPA